MFETILKQTKISILALLLFTLLTGVIYPLIVTLFSQLFFPIQANGSLLEHNGKLVGSQLIGQSFTGENYFWGRPSATSPYPYNGEASSGSNMGPSNPNFLVTVKDRVAQIKKANSENNLVPVDLVTASGSGLDPEISPLAAHYQAARIAKARHMAEADIHALIQNQTSNRFLMILGEPRVNVLKLNLALDDLGIKNGRKASQS